MDALSSALDAVNLSGLVFLRADMSGEYGFSMPSPTIYHPVIKARSREHRLAMFHIVQSGRCYLEVEGCEAVLLQEGDLVVVVGDVSHSIVDSPGRPTVPADTVAPTPSGSAAPPIVYMGESEHPTQLVCGMLEFLDRGFNPVFSALPPFLHVAKDDGPSSVWLQANLSHIIAEAESGRPGGERVLRKLTEILFVETLRCHLRSLSDTETGWFAGLNDPVVGQAIQAIHERPAHDWSLVELAKQAGVSRTVLSTRFVELMDMAPISYLKRWRIRLATDLLLQPGYTLADVADKVGYESESSFSRAFKREMDMPPAKWRNSIAG